ncbi:MAG: DUF4847 family protein [Bacteroidaceae bacterium]|nr:DUF4847 family protein [Bacteroidaceae bacterium]
MKRMIKKINWLILTLALPLLLTSCEREDDINAIFRGTTWYLTYIKNGEKQSETKKRYSINFVNDNFEAVMSGGARITGKWRADGASHSFGCSNIHVTGSVAGDSIAEKMYSILTNAKRYSGTTTWLQIIQDNNTFMQFRNWYDNGR